MTSRHSTGLLSIADEEGWRRRWRDWLWVVTIGAVQWPWLLRSLSGGSAVARAALLARLQLPAAALPHLGSWKADAVFLLQIVEQIARLRPATVVEFGVGASSLVIARALQLHGGGRLIGFDQHRDFVGATRDWLAGYDLSAELRHAPLGLQPGHRSGPWYVTGPLPERIDLLVIDGPPWSLHPLIRGGAERVFDRLPIGGVLLLDDAARPGERIVAAGWKRRWPGFVFRRLGGPAGTLIGRRER